VGTADLHGKGNPGDVTSSLCHDGERVTSEGGLLPQLATLGLGDLNIDSFEISEINPRRIKSSLDLPRYRAIVSTREKRS
jgi:hypothetical protein